MYLLDTDVISEARKGGRANPGVRAFFDKVAADAAAVHLSVITLGELRQGVERIRHRGDEPQARLLERWLQRVVANYADSILSFDEDAADIWGRLRVPNPHNPLDKQIAATALLYGLTVVTRNDSHYADTGVPVLNPFS
ncbi:MAG: type II toxin-antitoxin system VapC family toxin [Steroidobacteraceae bacterium]